MALTPQSWSDLRLDLAGLVLGRLFAHVDRVRFAAVCPQWRSAAQKARLPPPPPLLALKAGRTFYSMPRGEPFRFAGYDKDEHFDTASGSWLVYRRVRCLILMNPFSGATMTLPDPSSAHLTDKGDDKGQDSEEEGDDSDDEGDDSMDSDDSEEGEGDDSKDIDGSEEGYDFSSESHLRFIDIHEMEVMKLIVCSPELVAALFWSSRGKRVAVCRPGGSTWSVAWNLSLWITDMALYRGKLFVVDHEEDLLALDISVDAKTGDPQVSRIRQAIKIIHFDNLMETFHRMLYLVESCGKLLLVRRMIFHRHVHRRGQIHTFDRQCEPELAVFKADFRRSRWAKVTSLEDDQALFLGPCSRAVCLPQYDSPGNRVWFLDDYKDFYPSSEYYSTSTSDTNDMANRKFSSPLLTISWSGRGGPADHVGAVWLFPSN
ncbi:unnamed protein product [Urochloa decumbens]|uniref:KIB1-4 beta-propeller domain-containing protein n=1 Tax=Urochloa decumbens TaxID=240449 RepID=A0ABC9AT66_9POAL